MTTFHVCYGMFIPNNQLNIETPWQTLENIKQALLNLTIQFQI